MILLTYYGMQMTAAKSVQGLTAQASLGVKHALYLKPNLITIERPVSSPCLITLSHQTRPISSPCLITLPQQTRPMSSTHLITMERSISPPYHCTLYPNKQALAQHPITSQLRGVNAPRWQGCDRQRQESAEWQREGHCQLRPET